jgi:hypothetical protein
MNLCIDLLNYLFIYFNLFFSKIQLICHTTTHKCATCHNIRASKMNNHDGICIYIWKCINYAMWQKSILPHVLISKHPYWTMDILKKNSFHFLEMHKLYHVTMCNWLLQNLHIMIIRCKKLYSQNIWLNVYLIHVHCVDVLFDHDLQLNVQCN